MTKVLNRRNMKLIEFDLDVPKAKKEIRTEFRNQIRCIASLYERFFTGLSIFGGWKVLIECVDIVETNDIRNLLGVFTYQVMFDYKKFADSNIIDRKIIILNTLQNGILKIANDQGWPLEPFIITYNKIVNINYKNEWVLGKSKYSQNRKYKASLFCCHDIDYFYAWIIIYSKTEEELIRKLIVKDIPDEFSFVPKLGKIKWMENERVTLIGKNGHEIGNVSLNHDL